MRKRIRGILAAGIAAGLVTVPSGVAAADIPLPDSRPVGIAWDDSRDRLFVADQSSQESLLVLEEDGRRTGTLTFSGKPTSLQALALNDGMLYMADIGDRHRDRDHVTVFGVLPETGHQTYRAWDFRYPDGPRDALAFLVSGRGRFYFVTTGSDPGIYRADMGPSRQNVNTLTRAADAPRGVTDAVFLPDGETMALRTANGVSLVDGFSWEETDSVTYVGGDQEESITTFGRDRLLVGGAGALRDEPVPTGHVTATPATSPSRTSSSPTPTVTATPTATTAEPTEAQESSPEPTPEATAGDDVEAGPLPVKVSRGGTRLALAAAVLVAVAAGLLAYFVKN